MWEFLDNPKIMFEHKKDSTYLKPRGDIWSAFFEYFGKNHYIMSRYNSSLFFSIVYVKTLHNCIY